MYNLSSENVVGRGAFTTCYRVSRNKVILKSTDPIKECMSLGGFPSSRLFPTVTSVDSSYSNDTPFSHYEMKYYPKVKSLKTALQSADYKMYTELRALAGAVIHGSASHDTGYHMLYKQFLTISSKRLREALLGAIAGCATYGDDIALEISPRNVAVTASGKLILLDCFFMKSELKSIRCKNNNINRGWM
jgi:hypothetical protein